MTIQSTPPPQRPSLGGNIRILVASRGRGLGHIVPDLAIAELIVSLLDGVVIHFVTYASGAAFLRQVGVSFTELHQPEEPDVCEMVAEYTRLFAAAKPHVIVAHEEFGAVVAAHSVGIPCVFLTDFFSDPSSMATKMLRRASEVVFLGDRGVFCEPPNLRGRVHYVGRAVRNFEHTVSDRRRLRAEMAIPEDAFVILFQPGGWTESRVPVAAILVEAFALLPCPRKLLWLAGADCELLKEGAGSRPDIDLLAPDYRIDRLIAASDVVVTKGNRLTVFEAASLGVPTVSLSGMLNWADDVAIAAVSSNTTIPAADATPRLLADAMSVAKALKFAPARANSGGIAGAAERIVERVRSLRVSLDLDTMRNCLVAAQPGPAKPTN